MFFSICRLSALHCQLAALTVCWDTSYSRFRLMFNLWPLTNKKIRGFFNSIQLSHSNLSASGFGDGGKTRISCFEPPSSSDHTAQKNRKFHLPIRSRERLSLFRVISLICVLTAMSSTHENMQLSLSHTTSCVFTIFNQLMKMSLKPYHLILMITANLPLSHTQTNRPIYSFI